MMVGVAGAGGGGRAPEQAVERRARPQKEKALNCPRCNSTNTKFCYYNNYSLTQPRYFCKTCRRYWTEGGSLRNVPVGGGSRKNKRSSSSSAPPTTSFSTTTTTATTTNNTNNSINKKLTTHDMISLSSPSPSHNIKFNQSQDLNLAFPYHTMPHDQYAHFPNSSTCSNTPTTTNNTSGNSRSNPYAANTAATIGAFSAMELLRSGISSSRGGGGGGGGVGSFVPMALQEYTSGLGFLHDFRPPTTLGFPLDHGVGGGEDHGGEVAAAAAAAAAAVGGTGNYESSLQESRLLFPFEDLKPAAPSNSGELEHSRMQSGDPPGFWNGMIHGGGPW